MISPSRCVAVLGTGSIGTRHLNVLRSVAEVRPVAVPIRRERIGALRAAGFEVAADLDEAVRLGASACIVATDTGRHRQDATLAIEHNMDVLVEKPLAVDRVEAATVSACAEQYRKALFVGCVLRFSESLDTFRDFLPLIGPLHSVRIDCRSYLPDWRPDRPYKDSYSSRSEEGGVLRDLIHDIDYAGWLFGWPEAVQARLTNSGKLGIQAEEAAELNWETVSGSIVSVSLDYLSRFPRRSIDAFGESGTLEWNGIEQTVTLSAAGSARKIVESTQSCDDMLLAQDLAFLCHASGPHDHRLATGRDGVRALAVCDAARLASANRKEEIVEW